MLLFLFEYVDMLFVEFDECVFEIVCEFGW